MTFALKIHARMVTTTLAIRGDNSREPYRNPVVSYLVAVWPSVVSFYEMEE